MTSTTGDAAGRMGETQLSMWQHFNSCTYGQRFFKNSVKEKRMHALFGCTEYSLQQGVDAVEIVCRPHLLHGFLDFVLLSDCLIRRRNALKKENKRRTEVIQPSQKCSKMLLTHKLIHHVHQKIPGSLCTTSCIIELEANRQAQHSTEPKGHSRDLSFPLACTTEGSVDGNKSAAISSQVSPGDQGWPRRRCRFELMHSIAHLLHEEFSLGLDLFRPLRLLLDPQECLDADKLVYPPQPEHEKWSESSAYDHTNAQGLELLRGEIKTTHY